MISHVVVQLLMCWSLLCDHVLLLCVHAFMSVSLSYCVHRAVILRSGATFLLCSTWQPKRVKRPVVLLNGPWRCNGLVHTFSNTQTHARILGCRSGKWGHLGIFSGCWFFSAKYWSCVSHHTLVRALEPHIPCSISLFLSYKTFHYISACKKCHHVMRTQIQR